MATYNLSFGVKTRSGAGGVAVGQVAASAITGTGASDWVINSAGQITPSGTYDATKTFSKTAGQTYNLTLASGATCDILMVAARADVTNNSADTYTNYQLRNILTRAYTATGCLVLGDTVMIRDGSVIDPRGDASGHCTMPSAGYAGGGAITPGSGYTNGTYIVDATGGDGTGAKLVVTVAGGIVAQVHVQNPGSGYAVGNVLTATIPGGSGFQYTVIDLTARITIRSETPDVSTLANGNLRRGGGAIIRQLEEAGGSSAQRMVPWDFKYIDWVWDEDVLPATRLFLFTYRTVYRWGVSFYNCRAALDGAVPVGDNGQNGLNGITLRSGTAQDNYFRFLSKALPIGGDGFHSDSANPAVQNIVGGTGLDTTSQGNVFERLTTDAMSSLGLRLYITNNFMFNCASFSGSHPDFFQHFGFENGLFNTPLGTISGNVLMMSGEATDLGAQGFFLTDCINGSTIGGLVVQNNITMSTRANQNISAYFVGQIVRWNTHIAGIGAPGAGDQNSVTIRAYSGSGGLFERNITNLLTLEASQTGAEDSNNVLIAQTDAAYQILFGTYSYGPYTTRAAAITGLTPALVAAASGGALLADGTIAGALKFDGSFNDGTVWDLTPPSAITSSATDLDLTAGETTTITFQLDAAANVDVVITPVLKPASTATGTFSAATLTIPTGQASGTVDWTSTGAGTALINCTNGSGGSITNPATDLSIAVAAAAAAPTAFTQTPSATVAAVGSTVTFTYVLNAAAIAPVTITGSTTFPGVWLDGDDVIIPFGQTTGVLTFAASAAGTATFAADDGSGLTDPADVVVDFTACNAAQLLVMGIGRG